jgi:hypothetical protein
MRTIRRLSQLFLTLSGTMTVIYAVTRVEPLRERVLIAVLGLIIIELGIWQITRVFFPNEREFKPLREETDYFLKLVRRLNELTIRLNKGSSTAQADIDRLRDEMYHSVERMCRLAGRTEAEGAATTSMKTAWREKSPFRRDQHVAARSQAS